MERPKRVVLDPMLAPRSVRRPTSAYTQRPSQYVSTTQHFKELRQAQTAQTVPQASSSAPVQPGAPTDVESKPRSRFSIPNKQTAILYTMAGLVFAVGVITSLNGFRANRQVAAQVRQGQQQTDDSASDHVVPSATKPSAADIRNYKVAPNLPRYIDVPKLKVHARVMSQGVTKKGQLQAPGNIHDAGWYNASAQPGQAGAMLVDGHSGIGKTQGIFHELDTLQAGDPITITRGDGQTVTYIVVKVATVDADKVDMGDMLVSTNTAKPGLNLITCAGEQIRGTTELNKRVLVHAVLQ